MAYAIYLRKSRADLEAEAMGEGETLARHERALTDLAARRGYPVERIYREIVSGESISNRPQMKQLLKAVGERRYQGVLVMEVERLARGDTMDQATVANTFRYSDTCIVTPVKTYDPNNPIDEEYFEFSLFMSRREYKTIVRRMQTGRRLAVQEGKYVGSIAPYGYRRVCLPGKVWTLEPDPDEAPVVRMMFELYASGNGGARTAGKLNAMGLVNRSGKQWTQSGIARIVRNPIYIGYVTWDKRVGTVVGIENGAKIRKRIQNSEHTRAHGLHPPIVSDELFSKANHTGREGSMPVRANDDISSPLAGLVRCGLCGHAMVRAIGTRRPSGERYPDRITCRTQGCANYGCTIADIEAIILDVLRGWAVNYTSPSEAQTKSAEDAAICALRQAIARLEGQRSKLCDLLERGIYDEETYVRRSTDLAAQLRAARDELASAQQTPPDQEALIRAIAPGCNDALAAYSKAATPAAKNRILRQLIDHVDYVKTERGNNHDSKASTISISVYPLA